MNSSGLWMIWTTIGHELRSLDAIDSYRMWMIWTILGHKLRDLDAMNSSRLWMIWTILGRELKALDAMNNSGLWMTWTTSAREPRVCFFSIFNSNHCFTIPFITPFFIKLDWSNYFLLKSLIMPAIKGHNLDGFLFGTLPHPPKNQGEST